MAKKIIIDFSEQPVTDTTGFSYTVTIGGFDLVYSNGESECKIQYIPFGDTPTNFNELAIGVDLEDTLQITLDYLRNTFINSLVFYSIVDNTIEVLINADATVLIGETINASLDVTTQDVEPSGINLKYYILFDNYRLNIYKENYNGGASEIYGNIVITKSTAESILEPIRGTGLQLALEANQSLTFDEFSLSDEFTYKTELLQDDVIIYEGYIKPDGVQQSYVNNEWLINIESTDGLGALKDLSFVQTNGTQFTGKMSFYDVIKACLDRTRLSLDINTSINIAYDGYTGTNILKDTYISAERFIRDSNDTVLMDCNEVLTSVLNLFSGVITQQDGKWWIYRPNDLQATGYTRFINQTTEETFLVNLNKTLGSQINNFYPHHCEANQQIDVKGAVSAYRINYKYGFLNGLVENPYLNHNEDLDFDGWTKNPSLPSGILINNPQDTSGLLMKVKYEPLPTFGLVNVLESTPITFEEDSILTFNFKVSSQYRVTYFYFQIKTSDGYYLNSNYQWTTTPKTIRIKCGKINSSIYFAELQIKAQSLIATSDVSVIIYRPITFQDVFFSPDGIGEVQKVQISDTTLTDAGIVGENHTVTRYLPPSSITKENQQVFNGDGGQELIGSIYKEDLETLTENWSREGKFEQLPLLGISAMDDLRIQSNPIQVFSGSILGYIPYMSVVTIDGVTGLFMFTQWNYDLRTKQTASAKLMQFYNFDLADILYEVSPDYGNNTIKPTIVG